MVGAVENKVAIVTGGAMGIGRSVAIKLAEEGARVVIVDIDADALHKTETDITAHGNIAKGVKADIRDVQEIRRIVDMTVSEFGRIDILVNVAGVMKSLPFLEISVEEWNRVIDVNLRGTFFFIQACAAQMISQIPQEFRNRDRSERSFGKIVNFSSISGRRGRAVQAHYAATKAGVISLTQSAALAFAQYNINVNAVAPSVVLTPMWEKNSQDKSKIFGISADKASVEFIERIPLKRPGTGLDMAEAVLFLCSSKADYITGQTLNVDGGFEMN
ncbi:MAG: SDR family oxidoreductase [Sphaerochaetaceae bacterium]|nr:SDR family NAD(P)-dependent oxidoreductase [Sphaerochaetaceae bacterium]